MDTETALQRFEYPLPRLVVSGDSLHGGKLVVTATRDGGARGTLTLKNAGGQLLEGTIVSQSSMLVPKDKSFSGNLFKLDYTILPANNHRIGDTIYTNLIITSGGGEKLIPAIIRIVPRTLELDGVSIVTLKDFAAYTRKNLESAAIAFIGEAFAEWLEQFDDICTNTYKQLCTAPNARQSLESFLVLHKLKHPVTLTQMKNAPHSHNHEITAHNRELIHGTIMLQRSGSGYFEAAARITTDSPWLELAQYTIADSDFGNENTATITYSIDPAKVNTGRAYGKIAIGDIEVNIFIKTEPVFMCHAPKAYLKAGERGVIVVRNDSNAPAKIEFSIDNNFLLPDTTAGNLPPGVSEFGFTAKISPIKRVQMFLKKQPILEGVINVRITQGEHIFNKSLNITIGDLQS